MESYGFQSLAVRATKAEVQRWRNEAKALGMKLGDYLRERINNSHFAKSDRSISQTQSSAAQPTQEGK